MSELTHEQFFAGLDKLRDHIDRVAQRLELKLDAHARDDLLVAQKVTVIETTITEEAKQAVKRGAWAGIIAAAGLGAAWETLRILVLHK